MSAKARVRLLLAPGTAASAHAPPQPPRHACQAGALDGDLVLEEELPHHAAPRAVAQQRGHGGDGRNVACHARRLHVVLRAEERGLLALGLGLQLAEVARDLARRGQLGAAAPPGGQLTPP